MDSVEMCQNGDSVEDVLVEQLVSLDSSDTDDFFGDPPQVLPRVGDEYQVEIPTLFEEHDYLLYTKNPIDEENRAIFPCDFLMGLPIPVMWITEKVQKVKQETAEFFGNSNILLINEDSKYKVEPFDSWRDKMAQYQIVPGSSGDSWSDVEKASFLVALYIFEKNFIQVKRFVEVKNMGDIMSYYYGKFYRSDEYQRWSCRNMRSRKCAYGQRLFSGSRQQELLSRIFRHVSEECQNALREVSKTFGEGKMPLEEYVSSLKVMVGMKILVEAVGIGKGKQDLTGIITEPSKTNQVVHMRPEIPIGKACASLTLREIMKFLTGDYRLSKARSNDLFWEAVWPRLLARGWQSLEPKNQGYAAGSKPSLVFLMPGIKKFSRRKLTKGTHYFDSVTDVLSKVASEPGLIELDNEEEEGNKSKEDCAWTNETKLERDNSPERQRHCYLQPRTPSRDTDLMKFTVVDTSLNDGKTLRVRELRSLPVEISKVRRRSEDSDRNTSEVSTDESDSMSINQEETNNYTTKRSRTISDNDLESATNHLILANGPDSTNVTAKKFKNCSNLCEVKQITKGAKTHSSRRLKQDNEDCRAPVAKRPRKLSSCSRSVGPISEQEMYGCCSDTTDMIENICSQAGSTQDKLSCTSSSKDSPMDSIEGTHNDNSLGERQLHEELQPQKLLDLNLPVPPDFETGVFVMELRKGQDTQKDKEADDPNGLKTDLPMEQHTNVNSRRQSTRNRPPTVRALEALANGFLTINRRQKVKEGSPRENYRSRTSKRSRGVTEFSTENASELKESANDGNCGAFDEFSVLSEANGT
ncbi:hypothetical protein LguiA_001113 [Lonicera macranthoides]